ncbi:hypothetical protein FRC01_000387, partial [Tulasnella sp. 417]
MESNKTTFVLPQEVPLPLQDAVESLHQIIGDASRVRRNTQKILHFIARCVDIIDELKNHIDSQPSNIEEMMGVMESVEKLDILLVNAVYAVNKEVSLGGVLTRETMSTWESSRNEFQELVNGAYDEEFKPPGGWRKEIETITRLDDYLWLGLIVQDMRGKEIDLSESQKVDEIAVKILEEEDQDTRNGYIEVAMKYWSRITVDSRPFRSWRSFSASLERSPFYKPTEAQPWPLTQLVPSTPSIISKDQGSDTIGFDSLPRIQSDLNFGVAGPAFLSQPNESPEMRTFGDYTISASSSYVDGSEVPPFSYDPSPEASLFSDSPTSQASFFSRAPTSEASVFGDASTSKAASEGPSVFTLSAVGE